MQASRLTAIAGWLRSGTGAAAGLGQVAQVRQLDSEAARGAEDRLASADVDLAPVDAEGVGLAARVSAHRITICPSPSSFETRAPRGPPRGEEPGKARRLE